MTRNATFEFKTNLSPKVVFEELSKLWIGLGYEVDVYTLEIFSCALNREIRLHCTNVMVRYASAKADATRTQ